MDQRDACSKVTENSYCTEAINEKFVNSLRTNVANNQGEYSSTFNEFDFFDNSALLDAKQGCTASDSLLYVQYSCVQSQTEIETKYKHLSIIASVGVFVASLFLIVIYFMKR